MCCTRVRRKHFIKPGNFLSHWFNFKYIYIFFNTSEIKIFFSSSCTPSGISGGSVDRSDFDCPTVPDIPVQQPEQRDSAPSLRNPEHVATTEPMCSTTIRPTDCGAWQQKKTWWRPLQIAYYGMCGIKQPEEDTGKPKNNKRDRNKRGAWWIMELSAVGESVFAAESIIKRRIRRVFASSSSFFYPQAVSPHLLRNHLFVRSLQAILW